jgi:hypothetical protein
MVRAQWHARKAQRHCAQSITKRSSTRTITCPCRGCGQAPGWRQTLVVRFCGSGAPSLHRPCNLAGICAVSRSQTGWQSHKDVPNALPGAKAGISEALSMSTVMKSLSRATCSMHDGLKRHVHNTTLTSADGWCPCCAGAGWRPARPAHCPASPARLQSTAHSILSVQNAL